MSKKAKQQNVKVLYQNLGGVWYAFAASDKNEVYFGQVPVRSTAKASASDTAKTQKGGTTRKRKTTREAA